MKMITTIEITEKLMKNKKEKEEVKKIKIMREGIRIIEMEDRKIQDKKDNKWTWKLTWNEIDKKYQNKQQKE